MKAAMYNLLGMVHTDFKQKQEAIAAFTKAVETYPKFLIARQKLNKLEKGESQKSNY